MDELAALRLDLNSTDVRMSRQPLSITPAMSLQTITDKHFILFPSEIAPTFFSAWLHRLRVQTMMGCERTMSVSTEALATALGSVTVKQHNHNAFLRLLKTRIVWRMPMGRNLEKDTGRTSDFEG